MLPDPDSLSDSDSDDGDFTFHNLLPLKAEGPVFLATLTPEAADATVTSISDLPLSSRELSWEGRGTRGDHLKLVQHTEDSFTFTVGGERQPLYDVFYCPSTGGAERMQWCTALPMDTQAAVRAAALVEAVADFKPLPPEADLKKYSSFRSASDIGCTVRMCDEKHAILFVGGMRVDRVGVWKRDMSATRKNALNGYENKMGDIAKKRIDLEQLDWHDLLKLPLFGPGDDTRKKMTALLGQVDKWNKVVVSAAASQSPACTYQAPCGAYALVVRQDDPVGREPPVEPNTGEKLQVDVQAQEKTVGATATDRPATTDPFGMPSALVELGREFLQLSQLCAADDADACVSANALLDKVWAVLQGEKRLRAEGEVLLAHKEAEIVQLARRQRANEAELELLRNPCHVERRVV